MPLKILIIGFGSIGRRHFEVLSSLKQMNFINLVTKQRLENQICYESLESVDDLQSYDYFVISSPTNLHYEQLKYINENVSNKIIFCEKPLFESKKEHFVPKNQIYVGYVLRYHPLMQKLKNMLGGEKIICINAKCGQYLPAWRPDSDYTKCYSANKNMGGGVLLDLSHEIDYSLWLGGEIKSIKGYQDKVSDLSINSDDLTMLIGKIKHGYINICLDYISKITHRRLFVESMERSFELDFVANRLMVCDKFGVKSEFVVPNLQRNYMFEQMHLDILGERVWACDFEFGLKTMKVIEAIQGVIYE
ncbi:glucosamine-6-P synthase, isomerase subunit PtmF [Campylobacter iguaniorum]|uniref:Glucosamine-6-P synthase, isomerase subunit PtmF n=1 Tax=Campylobacter iguaniorum TaxID=1244531 RepID=A0A076F7C5_9BACT|nr:Gfo/Idh/MocA family oxidoreductase [Campylobacter iguaniorum]AII13926.1 glucosamine-6-P synthase, isomerase subunit PtmF [Campylobacter iguaniorum]